MVKTHQVKLTIANNSGIPMTFDKDWFDSGRVGDGFSWPDTIASGDHETILCYERDWSLKGCSGYTQYKMLDTVVTIAFSNPDVGKNKVNIGTDGKEVWDNMSDHNYEKFNVLILVNNDETEKTLNCSLKCTGSTLNDATVTIDTIKDQSEYKEIKRKIAASQRPPGKWKLKCCF